MGERDKINTGKAAMMAAMLLSFFALVSFPVKSHAQVTVSPPSSAPISSPFGMRNGRPHRGLDIATPCGTTLNLPGPVACDTTSDPGGYGRQGFVSLGCDVVLRYAHLQQCSNGATTVVTGGAPGSDGAGSSRGCHVHFEVQIADVRVDPQRAYSAGDLCQAATRSELVNAAQATLQGRAGGGGGVTGVNTNPGGGNSTTPPVPPPTTGGFTYVPGRTVTNPGRGYYIVTDVNGRTFIDIDLDDNTDGIPPLPPTTEDVVPSTNSTSNPVTGCATDTWSAMVNQAVLQTRREMMINERYVAKPDSVMAYSCLVQQLMNVGQTAGIFSESQLWANREIDVLNGQRVTVTIDMGRYSLDGAISNVAMEPYEHFLRSMFGHDFLGGMAPGLTSGGGDDDHAHSAQDHAPCGVMRQVWRTAKCMNMTDDPLFPTFEELIAADNDPRIYPEGTECRNTGITQNMIDIARGRDVATDPIDTYLTILGPGTCNPPIATGITVERQRGAGQITTTIRHADGLCLTAGCSYQNTGGSGTGRCEIRQP